MNPSITPEQELFIQRHCMQQLLHEALISDPDSCSGLLAGAGNMIESAIPVTEFVNSDTVELTHSDNVGPKLIGIYLSASQSEQPNPQLISKLSSLYETRTGAAPGCCLVLDLGHLGRIDALLYSDTGLTQPQPLEMLENGDLYPDSSNR
ncbi:hypothetical protein Ga0123461_2113 [Mariprofundus aestuarium]|uniref:Uncharacterized protein n=1 Tax=Mariprofundus aestuarium TaxID=1921086 RepID=A0A2K8L2S1_MARES|nr:hypothetical protein [Mariprofundus aestuarium]ATX80519.1 hypothetical protein Ga0123461_2113 [Mariprofundus aestuarium]